ncbi:MAG: carbohydrate kinase family protein [Acidimicrobiales bacterium]
MTTGTSESRLLPGTGLSMSPDVLVAGSVSFDMVFAGLSAPLSPGTEVHAAQLGGMPGGMATVAVAAARLGTRVALAAGFAVDAYGNFLWETLEREGIDLRHCRRWREWPTPVSVSLAYAAERSLVTHEWPPVCSLEELLEAPLPVRAVMVPLDGLSHTGLAHLAAGSPLVVADVGWDAEQGPGSDLWNRLGCVDIFLPNASEAMALTSASDLETALERLTSVVRGTVVVKSGVHGAFAARGGERLWEAAIDVDAIDTTGAGDVFDAGFVTGHLDGLALGDCLRFANLVAGLATRSCGSSLSAPCWDEIWHWQREERATAGYGFLSSMASARTASGPSCFHGSPTFAPRLNAVVGS